MQFYNATIMKDQLLSLNSWATLLGSAKKNFSNFEYYELKIGEVFCAVNFKKKPNSHQQFFYHTLNTHLTNSRLLGWTSYSYIQAKMSHICRFQGHT